MFGGTDTYVVSEKAILVLPPVCLKLLRIFVLHTYCYSRAFYLFLCFFFFLFTTYQDKAPPPLAQTVYECRKVRTHSLVFVYSVMSFISCANDTMPVKRAILMSFAFLYCFAYYPLLIL